MQLTSANSINVARFLPQAFYYFYAYAQIKKSVRPITWWLETNKMEKTKYVAFSTQRGSARQDDAYGACGRPTCIT